MPARKPQGLHVRHSTKAEIETRAQAEGSMAPARGLPKDEPARLKDHPVAGEVWRRLMRLYGEVEAEIVTRLDQDLLVDYCILMEQLGQIDTMRAAAYQVWLDLGKAVETAKQKAKAGQAAAKQMAIEARQTGADLTAAITSAATDAEREEDKAIALAIKCVDAFDAVRTLDARADQKRKTLLQWRQSLYLTPRSRAGAAPEKKEEEAPLDPMEALLGNVTAFVNGDGRGQ